MRILSSVLVLCAFGITSADAAPSVRMLGSNSARVGTNAAVVKSDSNKSASTQRLGTIRSKDVNTIAPVTVNKVSTPSVAADSAANARLSLGKYIHSTGVSAGTINPSATAGVASSDFVALSDRVKDLQTQMDSALESYYTRSEVNNLLEDIALGDMSGVLSDYATTEALNAKADASALSSYATTEALNAKADASALSAYATKEALDAKVDSSVLSGYATTDALNAKADASALSAYATTAALNSNYYTKGEVDSKVANIVAGDLSSALSGKQDKIDSGHKLSADLVSGLDSYATVEALNSKADASVLSSYATTAALSATTEALAAKADASALSSYATTEALNAKADASALSSYATTAALSAYATTEALNAYATTEALNSKVDSSVLNSYALSSSVPTKVSELTNDTGYITIADLPEYAAPSTAPAKPNAEGDYVLKVSIDSSGNPTYTWEDASNFSSESDDSGEDDVIPGW